MKKAVAETPHLLAELVKLVRGETHHARILSHTDIDMQEAATAALAAIATGEEPDRGALGVLGVLANEQHPLSNPDNVARAVLLASPSLADEVIRDGYAQAARTIGSHIKTLAGIWLDKDLLLLYRRRLETVFTAPGLIMADRKPRPAPTTLKSAGYGERPETVYVPPYRGISDEKLYRIAEALYHPTRLEPMSPPETVLVNNVVYSIMQAILENRYTMVAYAAADTLAGEGPITVFGPVGKPLLTRSGAAAGLNEVLDIVEQFFKAAGRRVNRKFLLNYFSRIVSIVRLGEEVVGGRLDIYNVRPFCEAVGGELLEKVRADVKAIRNGGDAENAYAVTWSETDPLSPLAQLHIYLNTAPYLTQQKLDLLEYLATSMIALTTTYVRTEGHTDRMGYMRLKLRQARESAKTLTQHLLPVNAYIPAGGPKGLEKIAWAFIAHMTGV
jgi:hypothetical protein